MAARRELAKRSGRDCNHSMPVPAGFPISDLRDITFRSPPEPRGLTDAVVFKSQIPISALVSFVEALEVGYSKHKNPYHNLIHAADVTQTVHYLLLKTGMVVSSLECTPIS